MIASLAKAKSTYANFGRTLESDAWDVISIIRPYLRNKLYRVSWESSTAVLSGVVETNSARILDFGYL